MLAVSRKNENPSKPGEGRASSMAVLGLGVLFVLWASLFIYRSSVLAFDGNRYFVLFDDAMISMRYGWNLAHGLGLVWNAGEYVEGYTNPLMTLAMALASTPFDKSGAVLTIQVFGAGLMLANAYLLMRIAEHLFPEVTGGRRGLLRVLAFLCGLSYYPLLFWSLLGMETGLLAVLVSLSVLFVLRYARDRRPAQAALVSVSLGLAFLTRPDAVVFALPVFAYALFYGNHGTRKALAPSRLAALFGPLALFVAGHEAFRWAYYGELLPNTYTLKVSGMPLTERIGNGVSYVVPFLGETWPLLLLVGAALLLDRRRGLLLLGGVFAVTLLYQVWTGGDAWDLWRIFSPAIPLMLLVAAWAILRAVAAVSGEAASRGHAARGRVVGTVSVLVFLALVCAVNLRFLPEITMQRQSLEEHLNEKRMSVVLALEEFTTPDATVGLFGVGTIPYYAGRPGIDFLGKMDPRIAHLPPDLVNSRPGHNKYDLEYSIKELKPTHVQGFEWYGQSVLPWAEDEYVGVKYRDAHLNLLKDSKDVRWDEIDAAVDAGEATLTTPR
ncbi:MAG: hypothetical protein AVDCRST_MAG25-2440 [uncultured Rubrobacteraceae bacterium]|uniref:Uncharacterized protein n=1 Tax=uncultured Rubrobacteraceae bacterium TaxID=349277 RepID=A0A6J4RSD2_9ACTN|nr:MAG: hypothetical protein AVDCRST_MAG25-2440 [uncultured Rubrobacteraceae bacterium]